MNAFSKIDMGEVTRLTQAGKLAEAMALLQGHKATGVAQGSSRSEVPGSTKGIKRLSPTIDMIAPAITGGAWTVPTQSEQEAAGESTLSMKAAGLPNFAQRTRGLRERLPKLGSFSALAEGLGTVRQPPVPVPDGARFEERTFSNDVGSRTYKVYVPSGYTGQSLPSPSPSWSCCTAAPRTPMTSPRVRG
jgi:hypothetical protein